MRSVQPEDLPDDVLQTSFALGQLITATRKARGLSQDALCTSVKIGRSTLVEIEHGSPKVQFVHWLVVLEALGLLEQGVPGLPMKQIAAAVRQPKSIRPRPAIGARGPKPPPMPPTRQLPLPKDAK